MTQESVSDFRVLAFFIADHAAVEGGKVYVNGGFWNTLALPSFPGVHPSMALVAVIEVPWRAYHQDHSFAIGLRTLDGQDLDLNIEGNFRVGAAPNLKKGDPTPLSLAVSVNNLAVERPGDYSFILSIDGTEMDRYPLRAIQGVGLLPPPPPT